MSSLQVEKLGCFEIDGDFDTYRDELLEELGEKEKAQSEGKT